MRINLRKTPRILASRRFIKLTLLFFVLESLWIVFSARYPQAFDESFHYGLIKIYSHVWSPFLSHQPANASAYGAVASDPSYLYHYLMSFPLRLIRLFTASQTAQVIILRIINILLFGSGLVLFKQVFKKIGASEAFSNLFVLLFVLIPIVPLLAAQINYDNLLFPLVALTCLLCFKLADEFKRGLISSVTKPLLLSVGLLSSLVTYAYLPILLAVVLYVAVLAYRYFGFNLGMIFKRLRADYNSRTFKARIMVSALLIISVVLFFQRYGLNIIHYHSLNPDCAKILSIKECENYSPWSYDYQNHLAVLNKSVRASDNLFVYAGNWFYWMWYRLFFAVDGPDTSFQNYPPLPLPSFAALLISVFGALFMIRYYRRVFTKDPYLLLLMMASLLYVGALFFKGYSTYKTTGIPENMNGRYLLPIIPMAAPFFMLAFKNVLNTREKLKYILTIVVLVMFIEGGGFLTYIIRSDPSWYWENHTVQDANRTAKTLLNNEILKGSRYYTTERWFYNWPIS